MFRIAINAATSEESVFLKNRLLSSFQRGDLHGTLPSYALQHVRDDHDGFYWTGCRPPFFALWRIPTGTLPRNSLILWGYRMNDVAAQDGSMLTVLNQVRSMLHALCPTRHIALTGRFNVQEMEMMKECGTECVKNSCLKLRTRNGFVLTLCWV